MKYRLSLGEIEFPIEQLIGELIPQWPETIEEEETLVREAIDYPFGTPLREMASEGARALILIEDQTRPTPLVSILPLVMEELQWGGLEAEDIRIAVSSGAHRAMTMLEKVQRLGPFATSYEVLDHHPKEALTFLGNTSTGIPLFFDSVLFEADIVVGIGRIAPHRVTGYSGGSAILLGMAGYQTIGAMHWQSTQASSLDLFGVPSNPMRREIDLLSNLLKLNYQVNVVLDENHRIASATAGDPVESFQEACQAAEKIYRVPIEALADIVICQAPGDPGQLPGRISSLFSAERAVKEGGVIILVDPYLRLDGDARYTSPDQVREWYSEHPDNPFWASHLAHVGWVRERAEIIVVSPLVSSELAEVVGFQYAPTPQAALELAVRLTGGTPKITIIRHSGELVPFLE